jgi:hypothetical protein
MMKYPEDSHYPNLTMDILKTALIAIILVGFSFLLQGDVLINLADEGFLWYGAIRTLFGDVPIRDFQSYEPGRYYWVATWFRALGNGIMSLRISIAIFQVLGLTLGVLALSRVIRQWWMLVIAGILLLAWMYPRHKLFEPSIAMAGVYFAVLLCEKPSVLRHFASGIFVGVSFFFGRNHGLYGFVSFFLLIVFVWLRVDRSRLIRRIAAWGAGIVTGLLPLLFMFTLIQGFFDNFVGNIGRMNLPLPVPWPWGVDYSGLSLTEALRLASVGTFFALLPAFYILTGAYILVCRPESLKQGGLFISAAFVGMPYMHHVFSRADLSHLAQGIHPLLIGLLSLPLVWRRTHIRVISAGFLALVFVMSFFSVVMVSPLYIKASSNQGDFVRTNIVGDDLWLRRSTAGLIESVIRINLQNVHPDEGLFIAPHWPGFYPILQRKSPLREIYFLFAETEERQRKMISRLKEKNVNWVILGDVALDGHDDLRFRNTHNLLWRHFMDDFEPVKGDGLPENYQLLHRK